MKQGVYFHILTSLPMIKIEKYRTGAEMISLIKSYAFQAFVHSDPFKSQINVFTGCCQGHLIGTLHRFIWKVTTDTPAI